MIDICLQTLVDTVNLVPRDEAIHPPAGGQAWALPQRQGLTLWDKWPMKEAQLGASVLRALGTILRDVRGSEYSHAGKPLPECEEVRVWGAVWPTEEGCPRGVSEGLASGCQVAHPGQAFTKQTTKTQSPCWQGPAICRKCSLVGQKGGRGGEEQGLRLHVTHGSQGSISTEPEVTAGSEG